MDKSSLEVLVFLFSNDPEIAASPIREPRVPLVGIASNSDTEWLVTEFRSPINPLLFFSLLMLARTPLDVLLRNLSAASGVSASMHLNTFSVEQTTEARVKSPMSCRMELEYPVSMD